MSVHIYFISSDVSNDIITTIKKGKKYSNKYNLTYEWHGLLEFIKRVLVAIVHRGKRSN